MSTADWCVLPCSYCINAVSNMYSIYQFYIERNLHALLQPSILYWMFLFWADYTLDKWQLDILLCVMTCQLKKRYTKILTGVRFCWTFLCSHVMKTLKLYEDMAVLCFSKDVLLLCSVCLFVYIVFPKIMIWNERNITLWYKYNPVANIRDTRAGKKNAWISMIGFLMHFIKRLVY